MPQLPAPYGERSAAQNADSLARREFQVMRFIPPAMVPRVFPVLPPKDGHSPEG